MCHSTIADLYQTPFVLNEREILQSIILWNQTI